MKFGIRAQVLCALAVVLGFGLLASYTVTSRITQAEVIDGEVQKALELATLAAERLGSVPLEGLAVSEVMAQLRALLEPDELVLLDASLGVVRDAPDVVEYFEARVPRLQLGALRGTEARHTVLSREDGFDGLLVVMAPIPKPPRVPRAADSPVSVCLLVSVDRITARLDAIDRAYILFTLVILALAMILGYVLLGRMVLGPVTEMIRLIRRIEQHGIADYFKRHPGATSSGELGRLQRAFFHLAGELADDRRQIQRQLFELARANDEIETANQQLVLSEKLATVGRLASGVAHEIGNPIAILQGYLELLDDPDMAPAARAEALVIMEQALDRVGTIIRDLLDFARLERDESGTADVVEGVRVAVKLVEPQKRFHGLSVSLELPDPAQRATIAAGRFEQVLLNLLFNAADASPPEGALVVRVVRPSDGWIDVEVVDQGPGITDENLGKIFDPFFTTKDPGEGTGLGLAISHSIVQGAGGEIRVHSVDGVGTTFTVRLPTSPDGGPTPQ